MTLNFYWIGSLSLAGAFFLLLAWCLSVGLGLSLGLGLIYTKSSGSQAFQKVSFLQSLNLTWVKLKFYKIWVGRSGWSEAYGQPRVIIPLSDNYSKRAGNAQIVWLPDLRGSSQLIPAQGDTLRCSKPPVDMKTKVAPYHMLLKLKHILCFVVNGKLGTTWMVTLYLCEDVD